MSLCFRYTESEEDKDNESEGEEAEGEEDKDDEPKIIVKEIKVSMLALISISNVVYRLR